MSFPLPASPISTHAMRGWLKLADLPDWDWYNISAHLKCLECGSVGWVDTRPDWSEVIDFNKGIS